MHLYLDDYDHFGCRAAARLVLALGAAASSGCTTDQRAQAPADLVLRGGPVYTVDAVRSWARALAVRDGVLVYVGSELGVSALIGSRTRVVELRGRTVLPAFQDIHIHPIYAGMQAASFCDLEGLETQEQYLREIAKYADAHPGEAWIRGGGWLMSSFPGAIPDGRLLDHIVPDRPVFLSSADGHSAWVNSRALALAGITRETPDPPDGRIDRDPITGEPIGSLQEGAVDLVELPTLTRRQLLTGLRHALGVLNA